MSEKRRVDATADNLRVACQTFARWNQIEEWLRRLEAFRNVAWGHDVAEAGSGCSILARSRANVLGKEGQHQFEGFRDSKA